MAYGDRVDPKSRAASLVMMAALVSLVLWGLAVGLDVDVVKKISEKLDVVDVKEEAPPPPEEPPPPPPPEQQLPPPPQVVIPPSPIPRPTPNVIRDTTPTPPRIFVPTPTITPPAPPAPPAPPPPPPKVNKSKAAKLSRGAPSQGDYPAAAERAEAEGTTRVRLAIGANGRVTSCSVTGSSGNSSLDSTTCSIFERRTRFDPALDSDGNPTSSTMNTSVTWRLEG